MDHILFPGARVFFTFQKNPYKRMSISGLVVEYIVAIDVTRVRFPADAWWQHHAALPAADGKSRAGFSLQAATLWPGHPKWARPCGQGGLLPGRVRVSPPCAPSASGAFGAFSFHVTFWQPVSTCAKRLHFECG